MPILINDGNLSKYGSGGGTWAPTDNISPTMTHEQMDTLSMNIYRQANQSNTGMSSWEQVGRFALGAGIDLADTVVASPLNPFGERGDVWSMASPEEQQYYERNKPLIEGTSAVAGGILTMIAAEGLLIPRLTATLASSTALTGTRVWKAAESWNVASRSRMLAAQRTAAESGEAYGLLANPGGRLLAMTPGREYAAKAVLAGAAVATRTAPIEYAVMWNNDAFNSGDWSREGFWIGVGAALGGTVGGMGAKAFTRMSANSDIIRDLRSAPHVMSGVSNNLLAPIDTRVVQQIDPTKIALKESAYTTEFFVGARAAAPKSVPESVKNTSTVYFMNEQYRDLAIDSTQKIISKGIEGVTTVKSAIKELPEIEHLVGVTAAADPMVLHGLASMGIMRDGTVADAFTARAKYIESVEGQAGVAFKKGREKEVARLNQLRQNLKSQDAFLLVNGSWLDPESKLAKAVMEHSPEKVLAKSITTSGLTEEMTIDAASGRLKLDLGLEVKSAAGRAINPASLGLKDRLALNEGANAFVEKMSKRGLKDDRVKLTDRAAKNWYTLDMAADMLRKNPNSVEFAGKGSQDVPRLSSIDDIERQSLRLKAKAVIMEVSSIGSITPEIRFRYNLPSPTAMERIEDPASDAFKQWLARGIGSEGTAQDFANALNDSRALAGLDLITGHGGSPLRIDGDMFGFNRTASKKGSKWLRPMLGYFDKANRVANIAQAGRAMAVTQAKVERTAIMLMNNTHISALANRFINMPEFDKAMNVAGLAADQMTGLGGGVKQVIGEFLTTRFKARDNEVILSASKLQEAAERHGTALYQMKTGKAETGGVDMAASVTRVTSAGNAHKMVMLDQYASLRAGWEVKAPTDVGNGYFAFQLKDTAQNRKRLGMSENEEWVEKNMPNEGTGKDVVVDKDGLEAIGKFNELTKPLRDADNVLRGSRGEKLVDHVDFFWPAQDTKGLLVGFVVGPDNKIVAGKTIAARSQGEFDMLKKKTLDDLGNSSGYRFQTKEELESLRDIWDEVAMDWIDPGISAATIGLGKVVGGGAYIRQGAFMEGLDWVKKKMVAQSQDTLRNMMREPLLVARARGAVEARANPQMGRTVWDEYERALTGQSKHYMNTSIMDGTLRKFEEKINGLLANSAISTQAGHVVDLGQRLGMNPLDFSGAKTYEAIAKAMGPHTPYANAVEYLETRGIKRPPTVRGMATKMNSIAAGVLLRWLEIPHAAVNLVGLMSTIPATIYGGKAPISTFMKVQGESVGVLDSMAVMSNAAKKMWRKRGTTDWEFMQKNGDATQSVIDYHKSLTATDSQAGFNGFMQKADKWASILTDTSESWSRQFAHFVGLEMADMHGITGMASRHDFAREIANAAIADYAPINRPELFSSGFGSMIGLFQSYALNHYQKMFRWMETGDYKKAGLAAALQAVTFGAPGTYSLSTLMDLRDSVNSTGSDPTALDLIYQQFGPVLGGAIAHGSLSQMSGLAFWSRGDMNFRIPGANGTLPVYDIGTKLANGFVDAVSAYMSAMPGEGRHALLEAVQRDMPSRVMRSWLTLLNGGNEIDAYGQVMSETRGWMDTIARTAGVRSTRQQAELEAFYQGKGAMERDAAKMDKVRESFRAAVRNNKGDPTAVSPIQYFNDYVKAGGNPRMFKTWAKTLLRDADSVRSASQLRKQMTTQRSMLETWRYGAYGAWDVMDR